MKWSVLHWLPVPRNVVLLSDRFSTLPTLLRIFMRMMREIGERALYGKHWNSVSQCCKRFEGSAAVDGTGLESTACRSIFPRQCKSERSYNNKGRVSP